MLTHTLIEDLQRKLLLYKNDDHVKEKKYFFNDEIYVKITMQITSDFSDIDLSYDDILPVGSELWKFLLAKEYSTKDAFKKWFEYMQSVFDYSDIVQLQFENEEAKNIFLDEVLEYILSSEELQQNWEDNYKKLAKESMRYDKALQNQDIELPYELQKLEPSKKLIDAFIWWNYRDMNSLLVFNSLSLYGNLIYFIVLNERFSQSQEKNFTRTKKLLDNCLDKPYLAGQLLAIFGNSLLIPFYLSQKDTLVIAMMHIQANNDTPRINTELNDYMYQWKEMLWSQALEIFFLHFEKSSNKKEIGEIVSKLLILLSKDHYDQNHRTVPYLIKTFEYLEKMKIRQQTNQPKEYLFRIILDEIIEKTIEQDFGNNFTFSLPYEKINLLLWLLSKVYKESLEVQSDYDTAHLISKIIEEMIRLYKSSIKKALDSNGLQEDTRLSQFNWSLVLQLATAAQKKEFLNIEEALFEDFEIPDDDVYAILQTVRVHLKLLLILYLSASKNDREVFEKPILKIVKRFTDTYNWKKDIFQAFLEKDDNAMFETLTQISNQFSNKGQREFIEHILNNTSNANLFKILKHITSKKRKKLILDALKTRQISQEDFTSIPEIIESLVLSLNETELQDYAEPLLYIFEQNQRGNYYTKTLQEIKFKSTVAKIFNQSVLKKDDKINQINQVANPFNDKKNFGNPNQSMQAEIDRYRRFLIGLLYFEDEPRKTYDCLKALLDESVQASYASNMLNVRYRIIEKEFQKDDKKYIEAYKYAIEEWEKYSKSFLNHTMDRYEFLVILEGCQTVNDSKKFLTYWNKMPEYLQKDLDIVPIRCRFLQQQQSSEKAKEYLESILLYHGELDKHEKIKLVNIQKELNEDLEVQYSKNIDPKERLESSALSLQDAQNYWLKIKNMVDEHHASIFSKAQSSTLNDYILENMQMIAFELLERASNITKQDKQGLEIENIINSWVTSLLKQRMSFLSWKVKEESRGGTSPSGKGLGERDIVIENQWDDRLFIVEAFRLASLEKNIILQHMNKLDGYNATGCTMLVVLVYCDVNDFTTLSSNYQLFLKNTQYTGFDENDLSTHEVYNVESKGARLKIFTETRQKNSKDIILYHLLCDFKMKSPIKA